MKINALSSSWGGKTLEWHIGSPPTTDNFAKVPTITEGPYEYGTRGKEIG